MRSWMGGCVENKPTNFPSTSFLCWDLAPNGFTMYMCAIASVLLFAGMALIRTALSIFSRARASGSGLFKMRAPVSSAAYSRVLDTANRMTDATMGTRMISSSMPIMPTILP